MKIVIAGKWEPNEDSFDRKWLRRDDSLYATATAYSSGEWDATIRFNFANEIRLFGAARNLATAKEQEI